MTEQATPGDFQPEEWTVSSNEALQIYITDGTGATPVAPQFTYPIFGDAETIYGYKGLVIFLCFDHYTFYPFLNVKYTAKLDADDVIDVKKTMLEYLPQETVFKDEAAWQDAVEEEKKTYQLPGSVAASFTEGDDAFDVVKLDTASPAGQQLHKRLQIMVLLFIEAASYIDADDAAWDIYVVYSRPSGGEPSICGFTTVYNYWSYPGAKAFDSGVTDRVRKKISQFVVLPNWQGRHLGSHTYRELYKQWLADPSVHQVVVEDPNEQFDDMRDRTDLGQLRHNLDLDELTVDLATPEWMKDTRTRLKLEPRQFARLVETVLLVKYGDAAPVRRFVKRRLWDKNREGLAGMDDATRKDKLQTAYQALVQDYRRIAAPVDLHIIKAPVVKKMKTA
ncbi:histone acetyltransferase type B catalytic subunit [Diutina catenulata]